jgi:Nucleotidyl transferase AbiEii toxin, Type IV TA system
MDTFIRFSEDERRTYCNEAQAVLGLPPASVEKDFWVCWTLRELFDLPEIGSHLTFKGGTSLSKAWKLINRFSEDIDIVIDREVLGFGGDASPDRASSRKQLNKRLSSLKDACRNFVQGEILTTLRERIESDLGDSREWSLEIDPDAEDGQCLLFSYPGVFPGGYIRPVVKIELGARSDTEPSEVVSIQPHLSDAFPDIFTSGSFSVLTVSSRRTFWEKAMLLHEETYRPADKPRKARLSRHYYDLWSLIKKGVAETAVADAELFERVAAHRATYFRISWVDYSTLRRGFLQLSPPESQVAYWRGDYKAMSTEMFFEPPPDFDEILAVVRNFEREFNRDQEP